MTGAKGPGVFIHFSAKLDKFQQWVTLFSLFSAVRSGAEPLQESGIQLHPTPQIGNEKLRIAELPRLFDPKWSKGISGKRRSH